MKWKLLILTVKEEIVEDLDVVGYVSVCSVTKNFVLSVGLIMPALSNVWPNSRQW